MRCTTYNQTGPHLSERAKAANGSARLVGGRAAAACAAACWLCRLAQRQRGQTTRPAAGAMQRDGGSWITWALIHSAWQATHWLQAAKHAIPNPKPHLIRPVRVFSQGGKHEGAVVAHEHEIAGAGPVADKRGRRCGQMRSEEHMDWFRATARGSPIGQYSLQATSELRLSCVSSKGAKASSPELGRIGSGVTAVQQQLAAGQVLHNPAR